MQDKRKEDRLVDAGSELSFPASDPPSYMGGTAIAGAPPRGRPSRERASREMTDPGNGEPGENGMQGEAPAESKNA